MTASKSKSAASKRKPSKRRKTSSKGRKRGRSALLPVLIGALGFAVGLAAAYGWRYLRDNKLPGFKGTADVYVRPGDTLEDVKKQLPPAIYGERTLDVVLRDKQVATYLKPGHYTVDSSTSYVAFARKLNNGWQTPVTLTLSGSLRTYDDISARIASQMMVTAPEIRRCLRDAEFLAGYGVDTRSAYSLFLPDTYSIYWSATPAEIFSRMRKSVDAFWTQERRHKATSLGLAPSEVTILASIVQSESLHTDEYRAIAGVYLRRLRKGMRLQADPTVAFIYGYKLDRILKKHLQNPDFYNTYRYKGLPPGPICSPSKAAIDAVLDADLTSGYMFFCASEAFDGTHVFARTYSEHLSNARAFQAEYDRRHAAKLR